MYAPHAPGKRITGKLYEWGNAQPRINYSRIKASITKVSEVRDGNENEVK